MAVNSMIVDANSMFARSYYAAQRMSAKPIDAVSLMLRTIILLLNPNAFRLGVPFDRTLFAWDGQQNPLKKRKEKPPGYHELKDVIQDTLEFVFGTANYQHPDYEGDDIAATAVFAAKPSETVYLVSADKDLQQLQGPDVHYYCLCTKAELTGSFIRQKWHVQKPSQVALALAITANA